MHAYCKPCVLYEDVRLLSRSPKGLSSFSILKCFLDKSHPVHDVF